MDYLYNDVHVEPTGQNVIVPNNDVARLMYYLSCVDYVINYNGINKLDDYNHYYLLTKVEIDTLIKIVLMLNPKLFVDAGIFILDPNLVPYGMNNEFYEITDNRIGFHINEEIIIGGKIVKVLNFMACRDTWLNKYYFNPLMNLLTPKKTYSLPPSRRYTPPRRYQEEECDDSCCSIY